MSVERQDILKVLIVLRQIYVLRNGLKRRKRRWWIRPGFQRRRDYSEFDNFIPHIRDNDEEMFFKYFRMSKDRYEHLLSLVSESLKKLSIREPVSPDERLTITLVYLSTGCSQQDLSFRFQRGRSTISYILRETTKVLWKVLSPEYVKCPRTIQEWKRIATGFWQRWNFPNCLGAIDGKHFYIQCPSLSGSEFYNYKHRFSTLVLAMCDSNYVFTYISVGSAGREGDAGVFAGSDLLHSLENDLLDIPQKELVPGYQTELPYVIVGDEAFPLKSFLMRPYAYRGRNSLTYNEKVFNYRLSRARRMIENSFGVLTARWRLFSHPVNSDIENCEWYIKAAFALHNYLQIEKSGFDADVKQYIPADFVDREDPNGVIIPGAWRHLANSDGTTDVGRIGSNMTARNLSRLRDDFAKFLTSPCGAIPWQSHCI